METRWKRRKKKIQAALKAFFAPLQSVIFFSFSQTNMSSGICSVSLDVAPEYFRPRYHWLTISNETDSSVKEWLHCDMNRMVVSLPVSSHQSHSWDLAKQWHCYSLAYLNLKTKITVYSLRQMSLTPVQGRFPPDLASVGFSKAGRVWCGDWGVLPDQQCCCCDGLKQCNSTGSQNKDKCQTGQRRANMNPDSDSIFRSTF